MRTPGGRYRQRGAILAIVAISLAVLLGMGALALDLGHAYVNKARLQNAVDAAALSGAKVLDETGGDTTQASAAAVATFNMNAAAPGNEEVGAAGITPTVTFSDTHNPWGGDPDDNGPYVRVAAAGLQLDTWFARVFGTNQMNVSASAVAGPSPRLARICNLAPFVACARDMTDTEDFGYVPGTVYKIKLGTNDDPLDIASANFDLLRLEGLTGADDLKKAIAGAYDGCISIDDTTVAVETETGNTVGPVVDGIGTLFCPCGSPLLTAAVCADNNIKPDVIVTPIDPMAKKCPPDAKDAPLPDAEIDYATYTAWAGDASGTNWSYPEPAGEFERRVLAVPMADCGGATAGPNDLPFLKVGCFFIRTTMVSSGNVGEVRGEYLSECNVNGVPGPAPGPGPGPYRIQLYKDPLSIDS